MARGGTQEPARDRVHDGPTETRSSGYVRTPLPVRSCLRRSASVSAACWAVRLRSVEAWALAPARRSSHCRSASCRSCSRPPAHPDFSAQYEK